MRSLGEEERAHLEVAHRNGMRLLRLVNSLLDFQELKPGASRPPMNLPICVL